MIKHKPVGVLPFKFHDGGQYNDSKILDSSDPEKDQELICTIQFIGNMDDIEYMVHAANAYPLMVSYIRSLLKTGKNAAEVLEAIGEMK